MSRGILRRFEDFSEWAVAQMSGKPAWLSPRWHWTVPVSICNARRRRLLRHALKTYGPNCHWCGCETIQRPLDHGPHMRGHFRTLDHLVPRSCGGRDIRENTRIACHRCNNARSHGQSFDAFIYRLGQIAPNRLYGAFIVRDEAV